MSLQSNLFREPVHGTWLITLIPTHTCSSHICRRRWSWCCSTHIWPRRMFWCCSTHIWPRRRFWCCSTHIWPRAVCISDAAEGFDAAVRISDPAEGLDAAVRISDPAEGFDAVGVYSLVATSSTIYESMKILNECWNLKFVSTSNNFAETNWRRGGRLAATFIVRATSRNPRPSVFMCFEVSNFRL